jgi:hypothetical protein
MSNGKTAVIFSCGHTDPSVSNDRYSWLGEFLYDLKPDYVVDLGDGADMRSLNTFDTRRPEAIVSQSYEADINHYNDAQERMRWKFRHHKRKRPQYYGFEGNHENRIKKAIGHDPRLQGSKYGISFGHLQANHWFDEYHEYHNSAPSIHDYDGVSYTHFFSRGNFGSAMSGMHHANGLLQQRGSSATCGHSHKRDLKFKDGSHPQGIVGLVAGCFKGAAETWAGQANNDWWSGVVVKRELRNGMYEPAFVSISALKAAYG